MVLNSTGGEMLSNSACTEIQKRWEEGKRNLSKRLIA